MKDGLKNEAEVLVRISKEDSSAFRELLVYYRPELLPYITTIAKSRERAEEVVQDVFVQIWAARESLPSIKNFRGFLFVISKNLAINALRSAIREEQRIRKWAENNREEITTSAPEIYETEGILDKAVAQLPPQQKKVWIEIRREGRKYPEVAAEMGISLNSAKKYVQLANRSITAYLLKNGGILLVISLFWKK